MNLITLILIFIKIKNIKFNSFVILFIIFLFIFLYFISSKNINQVDKFIEKPNKKHAKKIIKNKGYWNSGILFARKDSILNNFKKYETKMLSLCINSVYKSKNKKNVYILDK